MEEIQKTLEQMSTYMNAVVILVTIMICLILFSIFYLALCTTIDEIKERRKKRAADKQPAESEQKELQPEDSGSDENQKSN